MKSRRSDEMGVNGSDDLHVFCVGTADTKFQEISFLAHAVRSNLQRFAPNFSRKIVVTVVDVSVGEKVIESFDDFNFVSRSAILSCHEQGVLLPYDRGDAIAVMSEALASFLKGVYRNKKLAGLIGLGGSGGTSLLSSPFRCIPIGIPKMIISTVASGQTEPYIGTSDMVLFPSVVDICGINSVSRGILSNAASAFSGMVLGRLQMSKVPAATTEKGTVGITMFGVTTPCVNLVKDILTQEGYETLVFHATGVGGRAMEDLIRGGFIQGVMDITTTEVADYIIGGTMGCDSSQFDAAFERNIPVVLSVGALDMVNVGPIDTVSSKYKDRKLHVHNQQVTLMRTTVDENKKFASFMADKLNKASSNDAFAFQ